MADYLHPLDTSSYDECRYQPDGGVLLFVVRQWRYETVCHRPCTTLLTVCHSRHFQLTRNRQRFSSGNDKHRPVQLWVSSRNGFRRQRHDSLWRAWWPHYRTGVSRSPCKHPYLSYLRLTTTFLLDCYASFIRLSFVLIFYIGSGHTYVQYTRPVIPEHSKVC